MTRQERIEAMLSGRVPDRPLGAFWRHFHLSEQQPEDLAEALMNYEERLSWDLLVVTARPGLYGESWGNEYVYGDDEETLPSQITTRIVRPESYEELEVLDPEDEFMGEHLTCLRLLRRRRPNGVPHLLSVYSPLAVADILTGWSERTLRMMRDYPKQFKAGLETIAATVGSFAAFCIRSGGASGILLNGSPLAAGGRMSQAEFDEFGRTYDLIVLESVQHAMLNIVSMPGAHCMIERVLDYPVHAVAWEVGLPGNPGIAEVRARTGKVLVAGISAGGALLTGTPEQVVAEAKAALAAAGTDRFILSAGVEYAPGVPEENLLALLHLLRGEGA